MAIETLGCKLNQAESEQLARDLRQAGCLIVRPEDKADVYILNTCTVTSLADAKARHLLSRARRRNPQGRVIAAGCLAERSPRGLLESSGANIVVGNKDKGSLKDILIQAGALSSGLLVSSSPGRIRSFVKIQDGCNRRCTYCVVPLVRGGERSVPAEQVLAEIRKRETEGYLEVILTGTEVGSYRDGNANLVGLLTRVLKETQMPRLRVSSLQPQEITPDLIELWKDGRLCPHFHISLQSGSESVLKRMGRGYAPSGYTSALERLRRSLPDVAITTDIIVGFPGETEAEFQESYDFCRQARFSRIHVFPFSPRRDTAAARMPYPVASAVKKQRSGLMLDLAKRATTDFNVRFLHRTMNVLFEGQGNGVAQGLTDNYIRVFVETHSDVTNQILQVGITGVMGSGTTGALRS